MSEDVPQYGEMNEQRAREILQPRLFESKWIFDGIAWAGCPAGHRISLEGDYTADELEAIAWWMRNKA